jgi:CRISPR system Cascade subunit CasB
MSETKNWWYCLQNDRGSRARLRRADALGVLAEPAYHDLHKVLAPCSVAASTRVALVLAHVQTDVSQSVGKSLSEKLSMIRFRRLLQARDEEEIVREFRRAVDICGGAINVRELAGLLLYWNDRNRARLAFDYFGAEEAA